LYPKTESPQPPIIGEPEVRSVGALLAAPSYPAALLPHYWGLGGILN